MSRESDEEDVLNYALYLVDLPGFGQSDLMSWDDFKAILLTQLPEQFAVLGWSMGGLYAMRLALEVPDRVSHLMGIASSPYCIQASQWPGIQKSAFEDFVVSLLSTPEDTVEKFLRLQTNHKTLLSEPLNPKRLLGLAQGLQVLLNWDFRDALLDYVKPSCFLFGRHDAIIPVKTMAVMKARYPHFEYHLFQDAAHLPFVSHRDDFLRILRGFVR